MTSMHSDHLPSRSSPPSSPSLPASNDCSVLNTSVMPCSKNQMTSGRTKSGTMSSSFCIEALLAGSSHNSKTVSSDSVSVSSISPRDSPTLSIDETHSSPRSAPSSPMISNGNGFNGGDALHNNAHDNNAHGESGHSKATVWSSKQLELALASQAAGHPGANNLSSAMSSLFGHPNAFYASLYASSLQQSAQESQNHASAQNGSPHQQMPSLSFLPPSAFQSAFHQMKSQPNSSSLTFDWLTKEMLCHHQNGGKSEVLSLVLAVMLLVSGHLSLSFIFLRSSPFPYHLSYSALWERQCEHHKKCV